MGRSKHIKQQAYGRSLIEGVIRHACNSEASRVRPRDGRRLRKNSRCCFSQPGVDTGHRGSCGRCKNLRALDDVTRRCLCGRVEARRPKNLAEMEGKNSRSRAGNFDFIEETDEGLILDRTIAFRPMPAAKLFRDAMRAAMGSSIPDDFWEYSS